MNKGKEIDELRGTNQHVKGTSKHPAGKVPWEKTGMEKAEERKKKSRTTTKG